MSRVKSVKKILLDSSKAALFAGIEIHNKPHIAYRYQTSVILIINAWELALKAYIYKYIGKKKIFENDKHTISFSKSLVLVRDNINFKKGNNTFKAIFDNINLLNEYRCDVIHYSESELDPIIFMLISKAVLNYNDFVKEYFKLDITKSNNLIILPIGLKLPLNPIEYLNQDYKLANNEFVNKVIKTIKNLNDNNIQESIVIHFDLFANSVKNVTNSDILVAITKNDDADLTMSISKKYRLTNDPNATPIRVEEPILPFEYWQIIQKIKEKRNDIKINQKFNKIMKQIKKDKTLCQERYLNPRTKSSPPKVFYSENVVDIIIKKYDEENTG